MKTTEPEPPIPSPAAAVLTLRVLFARSPSEEGRTLLLADGVYVIGRNLTPSDAGLELLGDPQATRRHVLLEVENGLVRLKDLGSRNHTYVNGRLSSSCRLFDGDILRVGSSLLLLRAQQQPTAELPRVDFVVDAPVMRALVRQLDAVARHDIPVLLLGATGVGKEEMARALHALSGRPEPFLAVNCAALSPSLADSELFGHERGAFSGATSAKPGLLRGAGKGTIFLDEIGELPSELQSKLLRVLQERTVMPVGSIHAERFQARVVAATNRDLDQAQAEGRFRQDLYQRLNGAVFRLPPLRERREEILPIFLRALGPGYQLSPRLAEWLVLGPWTGNVRELRQRALLARARVGSRGMVDLPDVLLDEDTARPAPAARGPDTAASAATQPPPVEEQTLVRLLQENQGIIEKVAQAVRRSRRQVKRWMDYYGLRRQDFMR